MNQSFLKLYMHKGFGIIPNILLNLSPKTSEIKVPVLVISGTRDYTIGVNHPKILHFPNMEIKHVEGGHALYLEHTKELYNTVSPFLKKYGE